VGKPIPTTGLTNDRDMLTDRALAAAELPEEGNRRVQEMLAHG
jgi:hypothetical protein